jgi:hypothetical protein
MAKKQEKRGPGRPELPASEKRKHRAICWLRAYQKAALQAHAKEHGLSESVLLFDGLVESGVLEPDSE